MRFLANESLPLRAVEELRKAGHDVRCLHTDSPGISDPVRVHIFAAIVKSECPQTCSAFLEVSDRAVPKSTLSQHFKALREAGLIRSERRGVEMHNTP